MVPAPLATTDGVAAPAATPPRDDAATTAATPDDAAPPVATPPGDSKAATPATLDVAEPAAAPDPPDPPEYHYLYAQPKKKPPPKAARRARVVCDLCGREAGTASIRFHRQKCVARWPAGEPLPVPADLVAPSRPGPELDAYNRR